MMRVPAVSRHRELVKRHRVCLQRRRRLRFSLVLMHQRGGTGRESSFRGWRICWSARRLTTNQMMSDCEFQRLSCHAGFLPKLDRCCPLDQRGWRLSGRETCRGIWHLEGGLLSLPAGELHSSQHVRFSTSTIILTLHLNLSATFDATRVRSNTVPETLSIRRSLKDRSEACDILLWRCGLDLHDAIMSVHVLDDKCISKL